jgi:regulator of protease activity HflC (stomatin/prohibitin superfamily)
VADVMNRGNLNSSSERPATAFSGYLILIVSLILLGLGIWIIFQLANEMIGLGALPVALLLMFSSVLGFSGFYMVQPNQAVAITLFGAYRGSDRVEGLRWIWPWMGKAKISVRSNNLISDKIKVNDLRGNPIEIAAQVVWRVTDTAQALYDVDDYKAFVMAQIEAAVRSIGSRYPYDDIEHKEVTLRGNHDEVGAELRIALTERLQVAGISVDECGFTHLAYAPEIAGAMLRRQQAQAPRSSRAQWGWLKWRLPCCRRKRLLS